MDSSFAPPPLPKTSIPKFQSVFVTAPWKTHDVESGMFKKKVETKDSEWAIDEEKLAKNIAAACNLLDSQGYDIVSIMPITKGKYDIGGTPQSVWSYGYGRTSGAIVTAKLRE